MNKTVQEIVEELESLIPSLDTEEGRKQADELQIKLKEIQRETIRKDLGCPKYD